MTSGARETLAELLVLMGYPAEWADDDERRAFDAGKLWRRTSR